ncbi:hypothetical protein Q1695_007075 [Nippostrongylus brasiliensis]|nr:hypothetical protein Q1695_007075 [Nippostrongylus brasiliensis]
MLLDCHRTLIPRRMEQSQRLKNAREQHDPRRVQRWSNPINATDLTYATLVFDHREGNELPSDELPSDFDTEEGSPSLEKIVQNTNVVVRTRANNPPSGSPSTPPDGEIPILDSNSSSANPPLTSQKRAHDLVAVWDQNSENRLRGRVKRNARQIQRDHTYNEIQCEVAESFIDSHCHIDFIFNRGKGTDWRQTESGCWHNYFRGCIPNFIDPRLFLERYYDECDLGWIEEQLQDPLVLGATYGCHPHYGSEHEHEIDEILMPMIKEKEKFKTLAIGECGLDYKRSEVDPTVQKNVFQKQLQLAKDHELPLVVHCRSGSRGDAETDCLDIMRGMGLSRFHNIHRHCFTGSWEVAKRWMRQYENIYFGFTSVCAAWENSEGERQKYEVLEKLPLRRMLLETDAPYFRPTQYDYNKGPKGCEKLSFPPMAVNVAFVIARAKNINVNEVIKVTTSNAMRMYCIKDFDD